MKFIEFIGGSRFTPFLISSLFIITIAFSNTGNFKGNGKKGTKGKQKGTEDKEMTINDIKNYKRKGWFSK